MNTFELDRRLAESDPATGAITDSLDDELVWLCRQVSGANGRSRPARPKRVEVGDPAGTRRSSRRVAVAAAVATLVLGLGTALQLLAGSQPVAAPTQPASTASTSSTSTVPPPADPVFAEIPLTILPSDDWVMTSLNQFDEGNPAEVYYLDAADAASGTTSLIVAPGGGATEVDYGTELSITWVRADMATWGTFGTPVDAELTVLGLPATTFVMRGHVLVVVSVDGGSVQFDATVGTVEEMRTILDGLRIVSPEGFEQALPASVVSPAARAATVQSMQQGIPRLAAVDLSEIASRPAYEDRYQLGAEVVMAVLCPAFESWEAAVAAGDTATAQQMRALVASTRSWPVLRQMAADGLLPDLIWGLADGAVAGVAPAELDWPREDCQQTSDGSGSTTLGSQPAVTS